MQYVQIIEIPDCKMVSSGVGMFGDGVLERFMEWMNTQPRSIYPKDFLFWDSTNEEKQGFHWLYLYEEGMTIDDSLSVIDFNGGLYAVTTDIDQRTNMDAMNAHIDAFLAENGMRRDKTRTDLGNIITTPHIKDIIGYDQMNYWTPVTAL